PEAALATRMAISPRLAMSTRWTGRVRSSVCAMESPRVSRVSAGAVAAPAGGRQLAAPDDKHTVPWRAGGHHSLCRFAAGAALRGGGGAVSLLPISAAGGMAMLNARDNELLTRTGPGTPMGDYFRRFWVPVLLAEEIP